MSRSLQSRALTFALLAACLPPAARLLVGPPGAAVHVRWQALIDPAARRQLEARFALADGRPDDDEHTRRYELTDTSRANIRALILDPAVADTASLDRSTYAVDPSATRTGRRQRMEGGDRVVAAADGLALLLAVAAVWSLLGQTPVARRLQPARLLLRTLLQARNRAEAASAAMTRVLAAAIPERDARAPAVRRGLEIRSAVGRLTSTLTFGGSIAAIVLLLGTRDMEGYELSVFSLARGTALQAVHVLGHPVYTLALGLGVRLPLHGSLGASPAAALAPYLPAPLTYWVLMAFSIGAAAMVVRHALEPVCGRLVSWLATGLLFCSVPTVDYTILDDWPEVAVTYCAVVGCVFAPHALLALLNSQTSSNVRRLAGLSVAGTVWSLVGLAHPGYWPLLAVSLVLTARLRCADPITHSAPDSRYWLRLLSCRSWLSRCRFRISFANSTPPGPVRLAR